MPSAVRRKRIAATASQRSRRRSSLSTWQSAAGQRKRLRLNSQCAG